MSPLQLVDAVAEAVNQADEPQQELDKLVWLTSQEACAYLRYTGKHRRIALARFLKRHGIATARRERRLLIPRADLDRVIGARRKVGR